MATLIAMALLALAMSISPGPVNLISLSSGVNYGFARTFSFVSGATIGFTLLLVVLGLGLGAITNRYPTLMNIAAISGALYLAYLGYLIATAKPELSTRQQAQPTFLQGFVLQWLNPKAWIACVAGISAFQLGGAAGQLMVFATLYFVICYLSIASWALLGAKASVLINSPTKVQWFNRIVGIGLMVVAVNLIWISLHTN